MTEIIDSRAWYQALKAIDKANRAKSEAWLGEEKDVFLQAMANVNAMLQAVFSEGEIKDLVAKVKAAIAQRAFDLLWSAWDEMLAGRYDAATEHWRSIFESPDFLKALHVEPSLAQEWMNGAIDVHTARRVINRALRDMGEYDHATERHRDTAEYDKMVQPFSHVTRESSVATLTVRESELGEPLAFMLGPDPSSRMARSMALYLAHEATVLLAACAFTFQDIETAGHAWERTGRAAADRGKETVMRIFQDLGLGDTASLGGDDEDAGAEQRQR
jgi:hypothetical protein